jgi:phosphoglucomutase
MAIRFGTSGWRSIIADDFTYRNVELVTKSIWRYLKENGAQGRTSGGRESRFMGEKFSRVAAEIAARKDFNMLLCDHPTPAPSISQAIISEKAAGSISFTASHDPPGYQALSFQPQAAPRRCRDHEANRRGVAANPEDVAGEAGGPVIDHDPRAAYLADLKT